jgi:hypothetical protein
MLISQKTRFRSAVPCLALAVFGVVAAPQIARADCPTCPQLVLPAGPTVTVTQTDVNVVSSTFITTLAGVGTGFSVHDGQAYLGWCGDQEVLNSNSNAIVAMYSSYGSNLPANLNLGGKWPMVNYIINHKQGVAGDVQNAIWKVINNNTLYGSFPPSAASDAMYAAALANPNYIPQGGEMVAVVFYYDGYAGFTQDTFIEVPVPVVVQVTKGSIGDFVWYDLNHNGIQDAGEPGINGVQVTLYNSANTLVGTKTTDINGKYLFSDLALGTYSAKVASVPGATSTVSLAGGNTAKDSNAAANILTNSTITAAAPNDLTIDFGFTTGNMCALTQGYWKNHMWAWYNFPNTTMVLGNKTYNATQIYTILATAPKGGDTSLILAHQLIAAKFNESIGTNPGSYVDATGYLISQADALLAAWGGDLSVAHTAPIGQSATDMNALATKIDARNQDGRTQYRPTCTGFTTCGS